MRRVANDDDPLSMIVDLIEAEIGILFYSKEDLGKYSTDNCGFVND